MLRYSPSYVNRSIFLGASSKARMAMGGIKMAATMMDTVVSFRRS